jgi:transglutaminase-like putative cysteine protease
MSLRLPATAATAVLLASLSLSSVLQGVGWLGAGMGAVLVVGAAGLASRLPGLRPAIIATAAVVVAVVPLLPRSGWPTVVAGLVIVALTAASTTGARPLRGFAIVALYLAALLIFLNLWFAAGPAYGHLIPSHDSVGQLGRMVRAAFTEFRFAPPVPDIRPVSLVGSAGIGLVAIMVDLLAVRMRRPAAAGLPLLVLFSVPVASNLKSFGALQAVTFAAGMAGFLMLLSTASRERLRMWGQLVTFRYVQRADEAGTGPDTRELAASGRRIGLAAVCLAVIIPLMLPALAAHHALGGGPGGGARAGTGSGSGLEVLQQVQQDLREKKPQPVLTYTTTAAVPKYQYLQEYVLNYSAHLNEWVPDVTGNFEHPAADHTLPYSPPGQVASSPVATAQTTVTLARNQGSVSNFLPVPYAPVKLSAGSSGWSELPGSLMLYNPSQPPDGLQYTVTSSEPQLTAADLLAATGNAPSSISTQYSAYGGPDSARLAAIAHQRTAQATTELQEALELQDWFQAGSFTYTLTPDLPASHWLLAFLTTKRRGYCQQFAWAFAVLARLLGIPSRIAVGYTAGKPGSGGTWRVTTADRHAWPELYFPGEGWVRFEPTPNGATTGQGTATVPAYATGSPGHGLPAANPGGSTAAGAAGGAQAGAAHGLNGAQRPQPGEGTAANAASGSDAWLTIAIPLLVLLLIAAPAAARMLTRRRRWLLAHGDAATAAVAWRELTDDLTDYGRNRAPGETPRAVARRITSEADLDLAAAQALRRLVTAAERAAYAVRPESGAGLAADVSRVRRAVAAATPLRRRIRARLLPASTLALAQDGLQRLGDMLNWLDTSLPAMERRARQRHTQGNRTQPPAKPSQDPAIQAEPRELARAGRD